MEERFKYKPPVCPAAGIDKDPPPVAGGLEAGEVCWVVCSGATGAPVGGSGSGVSGIPWIKCQGFNTIFIFWDVQSFSSRYNTCAADASPKRQTKQNFLKNLFTNAFLHPPP